MYFEKQARKEAKDTLINENNSWSQTNKPQFTEYISNTRIRNSSYNNLQHIPTTHRIYEQIYSFIPSKSVEAIDQKNV